MGQLFNLARMTTATVGTGTITLGAAVSGFLTFAGAGVPTGTTVSYAIEDGANSEIGEGVYTTAGTTLTRSVTKSTNANAPIALSGNAHVFLTPRAEDLVVNPAGVAAEIASKVAKAGDTMTGFLTLDYAAPQLYFKKGASGDIASILVSTAGSTRWSYRLSDAAAESGADAGSNLAIYRYSDTGALLGLALSIERKTGLMALFTDPVAPMHAATKQYADTKLSLAGGSMTGALEVQTPTTTWHATTKTYVDTAVSGKVAKTGDTMSGALTFSDLGEGVVFSHGGRIYDASDGTNLQVNADLCRVYNEAGTVLMFAVTPALVSTNAALSVATTLAVGGASTFSGTVTVPTPTQPLHAATKGYVDGFLPRTAGASYPLTGDLSIVKSYPGILLDKAAGEYCHLTSAKGGLTRWMVRMGDTAPESTGNLGSDIIFNAYADAGGFLAARFSLVRGTGVASFYNTSVYKPGGGQFTDSSDRRIKNIVGEYKGGLKEIIGLYPLRFTYRGNDTDVDPVEPIQTPSSKEGEPDKIEADDVAPYKRSGHYGPAIAAQEFIGLAAQDVEPVLPECVSHRSAYIDGKPVDDLRSIDASPLIYALINAVKELEARVRVLEGTA